MSQTIELPEQNKGTKQTEWAEVGKKYKADNLTVYEKGEDYQNGHSVSNEFGYELTWKTEEDDIRVFGDGKGEYSNTIITVDSDTYEPESIAKLKDAIACLEEIENNRQKYYNGRMGRPCKKKK